MKSYWKLRREYDSKEEKLNVLVTLRSLNRQKETIHGVLHITDYVKMNQTRSFLIVFFGWPLVLFCRNSLTTLSISGNNPFTYVIAKGMFFQKKCIIVISLLLCFHNGLL